MATHTYYGLGRPANLVVRVPAGAPPADPKPDPAKVLPAPDYSSDIGGFEAARMSREMGRDMYSLQRQKAANPILSALMNMSTPRFMVLLAGIALLVGGLIALRFPVFLSDFDQWGAQINCGSAISSAATQATAADAGGSRFVDQCNTAIAERRGWTIPLTLSGAVLLGALAVRPPQQRAATILG